MADDRELQPNVGIGVLVMKEGKLLLGKRKGSHGEGQYASPGGHLEHLERFADCAAREVLEETGLTIGPIRFLRVLNTLQYAPRHYIDISFVADWVSGEPEVKEPDKVESWGWYDLSDLPSPLFGTLPTSIEVLRGGRQHLWDAPGSKPETSVDQVVAQLRALGVRTGGVLLVHTSFRAVGPIEDGPSGLIRALEIAIGPQGTLVMPTMTDGETVFDPASTPTCDMGITAETFWRQPGVLRSTHPGGSFAASGPLARHICAPQPLTPPHGPDSPPGRVHELDGQVLLLGVTHSEDTTLHVAEALAHVPYSVEHPCVVAIDGVARTVMIAETDHCCRRFRLADGWLRERGSQREGKVGNADARLCASRDVIAAAMERLAADPLVFLCPPSEGCDECDEARSTIR